MHQGTSLHLMHGKRVIGNYGPLSSELAAELFRDYSIDVLPSPSHPLTVLYSWPTVDMGTAGESSVGLLYLFEFANTASLHSQAVPAQR